MSAMEQIHTVGSAARRLGVSEVTIRHWNKVGKLAATRTASGQRLFLAADIERLAHQREAK